MGILIPLAIAVVLLGVLPTPMLDSILKPVQALRTPVSAPQRLASQEQEQSASAQTAAALIEPNQ